VEKVKGGAGEGLGLNEAGALAVADDDFVHVGGLPRCSS
jgi:hypothetical protein